MLQTRSWGWRAAAGGGEPAIEPNFFDDVMLQLIFAEANGATSGVDDSNNAFNWTGVGNAQVQNNELVLDGTGDYATLTSDAHHWNYIHGGSPSTFEFIVKGRPGTAHRNTLIDTSGAASTTVGLWIVIGDGVAQPVGTVRVFMVQGTLNDPFVDYTTTFAIPDDGADHHLVIETDVEFSEATADKVRFGLDGVRQEMGPYRSGAQVSIGTDPEGDMLIGRVVNLTTVDYQGNIRAVRLWRDRLKYDLKNNATYNYEADPTAWPTAEVATGPIAFRPRYWPKEESAAAGKVGSLYYLKEPRFIGLGNGEVLAFRMEGSSHAGNTDMRIDMFKSVDYGRTFPYSTRVSVADDATFAARNHAVGRDPASGRLVCFYRKTNSSDMSQGAFYKTSADGGVTWSSEVEVTSSLSLAASGAPWGRIVDTSNGLMAVFYASNVAEVLFSADGGQTWGSRVTMYDVTGTAPGYNEPFVIALSDNDLVAMARRDGSDNNDFAFFKSTDGGGTWSFVREVQWTVTTYTQATPSAMLLISDKVVTMWGERGDDYHLKYTVADAAAFLTDPGIAVDGSATITDWYEMRKPGTPGDTHYGYPDLIALDNNNVLVGWFEKPTNSNTRTRTMAALWRLDVEGA